MQEVVYILIVDAVWGLNKSMSGLRVQMGGKELQSPLARQVLVGSPTSWKSVLQE